MRSLQKEKSGRVKLRGNRNNGTSNGELRKKSQVNRQREMLHGCSNQERQIKVRACGASERNVQVMRKYPKALSHCSEREEDLKKTKLKDGTSGWKK